MGARVNRRLARFGAAAAASLAAALAAATPAGAVQTTTFGIAPAASASQNGGHLSAAVKPGQAVSDDVTVWNRTAGPLTLDLSVVPAHVGRDGEPMLGGDPAPATWVHLGQATVTLPPHGKVTVPVSVRTPRRLPHLPATAAILATPAHSGAAGVSVVVRLGVLVSMTAASGAPLRAPLGMIGWVAAGLLVLAGAAALVRGARRRPARGTHAGFGALRPRVVP